ncbi:MAG: aminotransferase class III-fold pyridoxal phosphate-dependent enzyme [Myxococcota bacterium]
MTTDLRWPTYPLRNKILTEGVAEKAEPGRGSCYVRDADGNVYLDAIGGIGCNPLGHGHPKFVAAMQEQLSKLAVAAGSFWTEPQLALAAEITKRVPIADARVFLGNTGTEVNEAGIKQVLRGRPGRDVVVAMERAFHGRTLGSIALTANPKYRDPYVSCLGEPEDRFARMNVVRVPFGDLDAAKGALAQYKGRVAAVWIEPIQGEAGIYPATREFLVGLRELCNEADALLAIDEIQCGAGRVGTFAAWSTIVGDDPALAPDVAWFAKALGGGLPVSACVSTAALAESMSRGSHGSTFGGNPFACAAGVATLAIMDEEDLMKSAAAQLPTLQAIAAENPHPRVKEIRGLGSMIGVEINGEGDMPAAKLAGIVMKHGMLVTVCAGKTVRLLLPYGAGETVLKEAWRILGVALDEDGA